MCLTLHLDNKRFLCLFVKFVLYRGPVLCEKHRISFFLFPPFNCQSFHHFLSFPCYPKDVVSMSLMSPVRTKTFSAHVTSNFDHVVRKTGLSTHASNDCPVVFSTC